MKRIWMAIVLALVSLPVLATMQAPDVLLYKGHTLYITCPLSSYFREKNMHTKEIFESEKVCWSMGCAKGYMSTWTIDEDNRLYLLSIKQPCGAGGYGVVPEEAIGKEYANLEKLFPGQYKDGKVFFAWITTELIGCEEYLFYYLERIVYKTEYVFDIDKGTVKQLDIFDCSKSRKSKYADYSGHYDLSDFLYNEINYDALPASGESARIILTIDGVDENGRITDVTVIRGYNEVYDREAVRVIKAIPEWTVIYHKGKPTTFRYTLALTLDPQKKPNKRK